MKATGAVVTAAALVLGIVLLVVIAGAIQRQPTATAGIGPLGLKDGTVPEQYRDMVTKAGQVCSEVSAPHIAAQIKQESAWDPKAGSNKGAQGIAQFLSGTWASYGKDANGNGTASPFEPADAIAAQAEYMCDLAQQVKGIAKAAGRPVIEMAWAAYNAGPGAVQQYNGIPPYAETQDYVVKLREGTTAYSGGPVAGEVKASGKWAAPLADKWMIPTSDFGPRPSPCAGCSSNHQGQDFGAPEGADIYAACDGVVDFSGQMSGYGNIVFIYCGDGIRTGYAHQSAIGVEAGQAVKRGQVIGKVGSTGVGNAPHLHFEVRKNATEGEGGVSGTPVDPEPFMAQQGITW